MTCERCGKEIPDSAAICPSCGTGVASARAPVPPVTSYGQFPLNVTIVNNFVPPSRKNVSALLVEIFLSLIGIYGVGWRMAGKKTVGTVLLIGSIVYWVLALRFIILTWGLGILCLCPVSIMLIIVNAILLNNALNRQATGLTTIQAQQMQSPPRQMGQQ